MFSSDLIELATDISARFVKAKKRIVTAESCTGGLIAALFTELPGSSNVFERGFVTYSNDAKSAALSVPADLIKEFGAVSEEVARAMAEGALEASLAHIAVAVTGVAGPTGGSSGKPVGLVHMAASSSQRTIHLEKRFGDLGRTNVRLLTVREAINLAAQLIDD